MLPLPVGKRVFHTLGDKRLVTPRELGLGTCSAPSAKNASPDAPRGVPEAKLAPGTMRLSSGILVSVPGVSPSPCLPGEGAPWAHGIPGHREVLAKRRADEPRVAPTTRGRKELKRAAAKDKAAALERLDRDVSAASAARSVASLWKTWQEDHHEWWGEEVPPLPLTREKVRAVAAMMKDGGYRSFRNSVDEAKKHHALEGSSWTEVLAITRRQCIRSCGRGIGPARQTGVLDLVEVHGLELGYDPISASGPVNPGGVAVLCSFYGCREIEQSLAFRRSLSVDTLRRALRWHLPASKTDPRALGCTRSWGCTCQGTGTAPCAYCAWLRHDRFLQGKFGERVLDLAFPAFPTAEGGVAKKKDAVATVEELARRLGHPVKTAEGRNVYGGHVWRVSGAVHLAAIGLEVWLIQILFRWASATVLRYVAEAPLNKVGEKYRAKFNEEHASGAMQQALETARLVQRKVQELETRIARPRDEEDPLRRSDVQAALSAASAAQGVEAERKNLEEALKRLEGLHPQVAAAAAAADNLLAAADNADRLTNLEKQVGLSKYIRNIETGAVHKPVIMALGVEARLWKTRCGWRFGLSSYQQSAALPLASAEICDRCLPAAKAAARRKEEDERDHKGLDTPAQSSPEHSDADAEVGGQD